MKSDLVKRLQIRLKRKSSVEAEVEVIIERTGLFKRSKSQMKMIRR